MADQCGSLHAYYYSCHVRKLLSFLSLLDTILYLFLILINYVKKYFLLGKSGPCGVDFEKNISMGYEYCHEKECWGSLYEIIP